MVLSPLHKQTTSCTPPHDWLVSFSMDSTALYDTCRAENGTNRCHLAVSVLMVCLLAASWLSTIPPPLIEVLVVLAMPMKKLSKMVGNSTTYPLNSWCIGRL